MAEAKLENSPELEQALDEWGLTGEFEMAQRVIEAGNYRFNPYIEFNLAAGTYLVLMKNGKLALGDTPEDTAQQAQYTSASNITLN